MPPEPDLAGLDWSMGSRSPSLVDWEAAIAAGRSVGGRGPATTSVQRDTLRTDLTRLVPETEALVQEHLQLSITGPRSRAWVLSRQMWTTQNVRSLQRLLVPLARRIGADGWSDMRRKAAGWQIGGLLGYASRKVLGQYDVFVPADDDGILYFVGPNILEAEARSGFIPRDFRFWIAAHEVTHRVQFGATPWLRSELGRMVDRYLDTMQLDPERMAAQVRRAFEEVRSGSTPPGLGAIFLLLTDEQRELFQRLQALMSLLEGHASFAMNEVAIGRVQDLEGMRSKLRERRASIGSLERTFQRASGFDLKVRQYDAGERFVREVVQRVGIEGFNAIWERPENLPLLHEIAEPTRWIARVAGA